MTKKSLFTLFFFLALILGFLTGLKFINQNPNAYIIINNHKIEVELARTQEQINQGLSGREKLAQNTGMLFLLPKTGNYTFWMKEMKFSLDFVFIKNNTVVDLAENIPPPVGNEAPQVINAKADFDKVLELNSGVIKDRGLKTGDNFQLVSD